MGSASGDQRIFGDLAVAAHIRSPAEKNFCHQANSLITQLSNSLPFIRRKPPGPLPLRISSSKEGVGVFAAFLPDFGVEGEGVAGLEFEGLAAGEVLKHDLRIGPLEVPAVFDGEEDVAAGEKRRHGERTVGVALIAVVKSMSWPGS